MAYKREHIKEKFHPKPGKLLDQIGGNELSSLRNPVKNRDSDYFSKKVNY